VVGVNRYLDHTPGPRPELVRVEERVRAEQCARIEEVRRTRDEVAITRTLEEVREAAAGDANLLPPMREALRARATLQEICDVLRERFGTYRPTDAL
jgi:methylmalonyl-CoA mutase, N-terminal domain